MNFENPASKTEEERKSEISPMEAFLTLPERIQHPDRDLPRKLGEFLVSEGMIKEIGVWKNSWGMKYQSDEQKIYINDPKCPISDANYNHYYFRLGRDKQTGQNIFPRKDEDDRYRFLHETCHAYQDYLTKKENPNDPEEWHDMASKNQINSTYSLLFNFCFSKREQNEKLGLSTWGNVPDYNGIPDDRSRKAVRAIEDANEMVVMKLWHPELFNTFLDYISGKKIDGKQYPPEQIKGDGYIQINNETREPLSDLIDMYVKEMKENIQNE
jgi:hypothetical protein